MYADLVAAGRKRSIKDRLNGVSAEEPRRITFPNAKRQCQSEGILRNDTFKDNRSAVPPKIDAEDLRHKLQRKGLQQQTVSGSYLPGKLPGSGTMRQQSITSEKLPVTLHQQLIKSEKLAGPLRQHSASSNSLKNKAVAGPASNETLAVTEKAPVLVLSNKISLKKPEVSVDSFLQSLGLEKYAIAFKVEEIDMTALKHMTDKDLKTIGLPMGPRKKILLALKSKT
ncbi:ankyrin repeat and SAM domain-containing protein 6-like [Zingiber officinale]|uniref:ankyrin repeat and SAM domain-containing protein 6-like n=1 Tax=Zingiber officinale TaxID=94328 RepID=UPI001C4CF010|nr:ankyrin repeat and SAM domain-containing protein 6-like [Zingiber officinale]